MTQAGHSRYMPLSHLHYSAYLIQRIMSQILWWFTANSAFPRDSGVKLHYSSTKTVPHCIINAVLSSSSSSSSSSPPPPTPLPLLLLAVLPRSALGFLKGVGFSLRRRIQMALCAQYSPTCLIKLMGHCPPREAVTQLRKVHKPTKWTIQQPISFSAAHLQEWSLSYKNANKQWTKWPANSVQHIRSSVATNLSLEKFTHWITNCTGQSPQHTLHSFTYSGANPGHVSHPLWCIVQP